MKYLSSSDTAKKWSISDSRIRRLAKQGKIPMAQRVGNCWMIPENATKPIDGRTKDAKRTKSEYKFPLLYLNNYSIEEIAYFSEDEKILYEAELLCLNCEFEKSKKILEELLKTTSYSYIKVGILYVLFFTYLYSGYFEKADNSLLSLKVLFQSDFDHKRELSVLLEDLLQNAGHPEEIRTDFGFDLSQTYSKTGETFIILLETYRDLSDLLRDQKPINAKIYEIICKRLESEGMSIAAMYMHCYIGFMYQYYNAVDKAKNHFKKSIDMAIENSSYTPLLGITMAIFELYQSVLKEYPIEVQKFFIDNHNTFRKNYFTYIERTKGISYYKDLTDEDVEYLNFVVSGVPNKVISKLKNLSESTINKKYLAIYQKLDISGKKELRNLAISHFSTDGT